MEKQVLRIIIGVMLILIATTITSKAVSTGEVIGQVMDQDTKTPVPFAVIVFENSMDRIVVTANEYGYYYSMHMPTGKYQMSVVYYNRTFVMNKVKVFDSYTSEVNFMVSNNPRLPSVVQVPTSEPIISSVASTDAVLNNSSFNQPTRSLSDALSTLPGCDIYNGKLYVKGSSQVRFFIDGTPVMGQPVIDRIW